jgi:hypothetical protein
LATGTTISLFLLLVRVWELFFRRPKFQVDFRWNEDLNGIVEGLSFVIMNLGQAKGGVLEIGFTRPDTPDDNFWPVGVYDEFPIVLDLNDVTRRFQVDLTTDDHVSRGLPDGTLTTLTVRDLDGDSKRHPLPARYKKV